MINETQRETEAAARCVLEIMLDDGEEIWSQAGDAATARANLAALHTRLDADAFVLLGDTVVRSADVRYVRLHVEEPRGGGAVDAFATTRGGHTMSSYDDEQQTTIASRAHPRSRPGGGGPGFADQYVGYGWRPWAETKPFFMTSEFFGTIALIAAILIAAAVDDGLDATRAWTLAAVIGAAYIISRGLAKSGTKDPNPTRDGAR